MAADWPPLSTNHHGPSLAQEGVGCLPASRTTIWKWVLLFIVPGAIYCPSAVSGTGTVFPPARCTRSHAGLFLLACRRARCESPHQQMPAVLRETIHLPLQVDKFPSSPRAHLHPMPSDRHCFGPAMTRPLIDGWTSSPLNSPQFWPSEQNATAGLASVVRNSTWRRNRAALPRGVAPNHGRTAYCLTQSAADQTQRTSMCFHADRKPRRDATRTSRWSGTAARMFP